MHESEKWKWSCSVVSDSSRPQPAAYQAPPSMGFSRQEYWSGVPLPYGLTTITFPSPRWGPPRHRGVKDLFKVAQLAVVGQSGHSNVHLSHSLHYLHQGRFHRGFGVYLCYLWDSQVTLVVKNPPANAGDQCWRCKRRGFNPWVKIPWRGTCNPLQYSCLENPMDRGTWWITVHWVAKNQTWLKWLSAHIDSFYFERRGTKAQGQGICRFLSWFQVPFAVTWQWGRLEIFHCVKNQRPDRRQSRRSPGSLSHPQSYCPVGGYAQLWAQRGQPVGLWPCDWKGGR